MEEGKKEVGHTGLAKLCLCPPCTGVSLMPQLLLKVLSEYALLSPEEDILFFPLSGGIIKAQ